MMVLERVIMEEIKKTGDQVQVELRSTIQIQQTGPMSQYPQNLGIC